MSKKKESCIKTVNVVIPPSMEYTVLLNTDKQRVRFIKQCEKMARASMEYRNYMSFLKEYCDMNRCAFFQKITTKDMKVRLEIHHEPFTLYDICEVVLDKFIKEGKSINALLISDEVLENHYDNLVGLIPLSKTIHEVYHNTDKIVIPLSMVYGDYKRFLDKYDDYMSEELSDRLYSKLEAKIEETKNITEETFADIQKQFIYLNMEGVELPDKVEIVKEKVS